MLLLIWTDRTFVAQEFARGENRLSAIENTLHQLVALLSTTRDTRALICSINLVELSTRINIPLSLIRSPEFIRYVICPGFSMRSFPELRPRQSLKKRTPFAVDDPAHLFQNCLRARFQKTEDIGQLGLSFLLTPSGLE
jgi:hypothetical protein